MNEESNEVVEVFDRPHVWLHSVTLRNSQRLELGRHEIIAVVGPNNAGKSALLRDISSLLQSATNAALIVRSLETVLKGNVEAVANWGRGRVLEMYRASQSPDPPVTMPFGNMNLSSLVNSWSSGLAGNGFINLVGLFSVHLQTENRLTAANNVSSINTVTQPATSPLHHIYEDELLEARLSRIFKQAFGTDLVINRSAGRDIVLHMGDRPVPPEGKDRVSNEFRRAVHALPMVQSQGDGIKSFVGVLLDTLVVDRDIILIDEPDAFLHPPQATLLGRVLATELPSPRQLIVATHSSDLLRGLLDAPHSTVRVVRIRRERGENKITELEPEDVREVWRDPLLRYSKVLDGLFHDGVIVCESDGDCRFYGAMMDAVAGEEHRPDLHLVHGAGKSRVATIIRALRALDVPVRAVVDFDALNDETGLRSICEALGGLRNDVAADWKKVKAAIEKRRPQLSAEKAKEEISAVFDRVEGPNLSDDGIKEIKDVLKATSAWSEAKRIGKAFLPSGEERATYERLAGQLRALGLYLVEVGELEGFCPTAGAHGPAWVAKVLERDLENDEELETARKFAKMLLSGW